MSTQPDVLIAGAGPSGLALALLLCRNGLSVRIIDKRSDFKVGQRGAGIHARTLELYKLLGIVSEVEKRSMKLPLRKIYVRGQDEPTSQEPLMEQLPLEPHFFRINGEILRQEEHQNLLREILQNEYGIWRSRNASTELECLLTQDS
ncbi:hypothetical protein VNI00_015095 [Paramarasmius palmivorus]|uniref:FAD-binding domain-containing protein n=1 Tax=Paramarasmius palmivorus TaxID=297713 RepID=A0AAW0BND0_9AGAR